MTCCCALAGTKACFTCPNNMTGVWDRYPAPFVRENYLWLDSSDEDTAEDQQVAPA